MTFDTQPLFDHAASDRLTQRIAREMAARDEEAAHRLVCRHLEPRWWGKSPIEMIEVLLYRGVHMARLEGAWPERPVYAILARPAVIGEVPDILDSEPCTVLSDITGRRPFNYWNGYDPTP